MKYVFVLEDESKFQSEVCQALLEIDPKLQIRLFSQLEEFATWMKSAAREGPKSLAQAGHALNPDAGDLPSEENDQLVLIVSKEEFLGSKWIALIKKTRQWFISKKICSEADPTSLVITVFNSPSFEIKLVEDRIINNVIFKPFDLLLLKQHLHFAVHGRHAPSELSVHNMKTTALIEVIKDVQLEKISELGMTTLSTRPIPIHAVAKYYSQLFVSNTHKSIIAICTLCERIPGKELSYRCTFRFYGTDRNQVRQIRTKSVAALQKETLSLTGNSFNKLSKGDIARMPMNEIVIVSPDSDNHESLKHLFTNQFYQISTVQYGSLAQFQFALDPAQKTDKASTLKIEDIPKLPTKATALVVDLKSFGYLDWTDNEAIESLFSKFKESIVKRYPRLPTIYFVSERGLSDQSERILSTIFQGDLFYDLTDSMHLMKRILYCQGSQLVPKEPVEYVRFEELRTIQTANPVHVSELSEAGIVVQYHRPITIGSFRRFVLWTPHELGNPEFLASCNFSDQKASADGSFLNQFVFFGLTDADLKHIRLWIIHNYVSSKQAA